MKRIMLCLSLSLALVAEENKSKTVNLNKLPPIPGLPASPVQKHEEVDKFLANLTSVGTFNGEEMSKEKLANELKLNIRSQRQALTKSEVERLARRIAQKQLEQLTLLEEVSIRGIASVDKEAVGAELSKLEKRFGGAKNFQAKLKRDGLDQAKLVKIIQSNLLLRKLQDNVAKDIKISDKEIEVHYNNNRSRFKVSESVHASHILKKLPKDATPEQKAEARKEIERVQELLKQGEDFASLAKKESDCNSKTKGGDLGKFTKGRMIKPFEDAAFAMKPGETSGIIETKFGFHIIKVIDKTAEHVKKLDEVKPDIIQFLSKGKIHGAFKKIINKNMKQFNARLNF